MHVQPLVRELKSHMLRGQKTKTQNRKKSITFKMVHIKNKNKKVQAGKVTKGEVALAGFLEEEALHWGLEERCELENVN